MFHIITALPKRFSMLQLKSELLESIAKFAIILCYKLARTTICYYGNLKPTGSLGVSKQNPLN